jgi:ATP-dependent RNA helicase DeaD
VFRDEPPPPPRYQERPGPGPRGGGPPQHQQQPQQNLAPRGALVRHRLEVGWDHGAAPKNIVGAIANEAGLDGRFISRLEIRNDYSLVDLPADLPQSTLKRLSQMRICGQEARLRRLPAHGEAPAREAYAEDERPQSGYSKPGYPKGPPKPRPPFRPDFAPRKAGPGGPYEPGMKAKAGKPYVRKPKPQAGAPAGGAPAGPVGGTAPKKRKPKPEGSGSSEL